MYGACEFPGTETEGLHTIVACTVTAASIAAFAALPSIWNTPFSGWEDWIIVCGDSLLGYVCSHEKFGTIYGDRARLKDLGPGRVRGCSDADRAHKIRGVPAATFNDELSARIGDVPFARGGAA